jgi:ribosomal protein S18 acetylase RimI-like enzyme
MTALCSQVLCVERLNTFVEGLELRPAEDHDFAAVAALFRALHEFNAQLDYRFRLDERWSDLLRIHFMRTHNAPGALWLLAWADTTPVGLLVMEAHNDSPLFAERRWAELVALYIVPSHRGSDLGERLVTIGKQWAAAHGFDRLQLYVTASNERARAFYRRCGLAPAQEIWRADLIADPVEPPADPSHHTTTDDDPPIELGHHPLAMELADEEHP